MLQAGAVEEVRPENRGITVNSQKGKRSSEQNCFQEWPLKDGRRKALPSAVKGFGGQLSGDLKY